MHEQLQNEISKLMRKDMDRRDFLKHVGIGFAGIMGVTSVLKTISHINSGQPSGRTAQSGYGSSVYGGQKRA